MGNDKIVRRIRIVWSAEGTGFNALGGNNGSLTRYISKVLAARSLAASRQTATHSKLYVYCSL